MFTLYVTPTELLVDCLVDKVTGENESEENISHGKSTNWKADILKKVD